MSTLPLPRLDAKHLASIVPLSTTPVLGRDRPERILQFGEGGFLRGFVDWMIHKLNTKGLFNGSIVVVQPLASGSVPLLNEQDGLYTQILRGIQGGRATEERGIISAISRGIAPHSEFSAFLGCAENPNLRFIVSNTTEAGIACDPRDIIDAKPAASFPGKLTQFLFARYRHFNGAPERGLVILPCELIEYNGSHLKRCVLETARKWKLEAPFLQWASGQQLFLQHTRRPDRDGLPDPRSRSTGTRAGLRGPAAQRR